MLLVHLLALEVVCCSAMLVVECSIATAYQVVEDGANEARIVQISHLGYGGKGTIRLLGLYAKVQ